MKPPKRTWLSKDRQYKVVCYREFMGVSLGTKRYYALVRTQAAGSNGKPVWAHAGPRRSFRKAGPAAAACKRNRNLWQSFLRTAKTKGVAARNERLKALRQRSKSGTTSYSVQHIIQYPPPCWVAKVDPKWVLKLRK